MLVLNRRKAEGVLIGGNISVHIIDIRHGDASEPLPDFDDILDDLADTVLTKSEVEELTELTLKALK
jgi:hypothetical protein